MVIAVSNREESPTAIVSHDLPAHKFAPTIDSVDLDKVFDHRFVDSRSRPVKCHCIGFYACQRHLRGVGNLDT